MAIKAVVTEEEFTGLADGVKSLYAKNDDGAYVLDVDGVDSHPAVSGLKNNHDRLLGEKKAADKARAEAERLAAEKAAADALQKGEFEQLYKSAKSELDAKAAEIEEIKGRVASEKLNSEAVKLASQLASESWRQELLVEQIQKRLALTDEGIKIKDAAGNLTVQTMKQFTDEIKGKYPGLVDGSKSTGGGASKQSQDGGAGGGKQNMAGTPAERRAAIAAKYDLDK